MQHISFLKDYLDFKNLVRHTRNFMYDHAQSLRRIEEQAQMQYNPTNVVPFRQHRAVQPLHAVDNFPAPPPIRTHLLIPVREGLSIERAAEDVHTQSLRVAFLNGLVLAPLLFQDVESLKAFGPVTIYIAHVERLSLAQHSVLKVYLAEPLTNDSPLIIAGI